MIRKALKWDDLFESEFEKLALKVSQIFKIIDERIKQYGLTLVMAEVLSELINITNILLNSHPNWITEGCDKYGLALSVSGIYQQLIDLFDTISDLGLKQYFEENCEQRVKNELVHRDKSMVSIRKRNNSNNRITCLVSNFKRSTLGPQSDANEDNDSFKISSKSINNQSTKASSVPQFQKTLTNIAMSRKKSVKKLSYDKNKDLDYEQGVLIDYVINDEDPFSANIILQCCKFLNILVENMCGNEKLQLAIFKSGIVWRQLLFMMDDFSSWPLSFMLEPSVIEKLCCSSLRYLFSNCDNIQKLKLAEKEESKEDIEASKDELMMLEYYKMCQSLLGFKSVEKLVSKIEITEFGCIKIQDEFDLFPFFIEIYRSSQHTSPDLIWNQRTRDELKLILQKEIKDIKNGESDWDKNPYEEYNYTECSKELRVDGVFIRLLNKDIYYTHRNPTHFLDKLVQTIFEIKDDLALSYEVLTALRSLISSPIIEDVTTKMRRQLVKLIKIFIDYKNPLEINQKYSKISSFVIDIIGQCIKKNQYCEDFFENEGLCDMLVELIYHNKNERIPIESLISCIQAISTWQNVNIEKYLWNSGLLGLLFRYIFYVDDVRIQVKVIHYFLCNTNQNIVKYGSMLINSFLPLDFSQVSSPKSAVAVQPEFGSGPRQRGTSMTRKNHYINLHGDEFEEKSTLYTGTAEDIIEQELDRMSQEYSEGLRTIWSSKITSDLKEAIDNIHFEKLRNEPERANDLERPFNNPLLQKETIVNGIILRVYNMKSVKSVQINNEEFLKSLFNELRIVNNEYSIKSSYISKLEKESKSDEEEKSSSDSDKEKMNFKYLVSSTVSESDFNNFNPELIDEYQDDTKYLESKLTIILSSILVNITN